MDARLVGVERILGGTDLVAELAGVAVAAARMIGLHVVDHVVALTGLVGADQTPVLLLTAPREILAQQMFIIAWKREREGSSSKRAYWNKGD
jgi:hypothetical protein